MRGQSRDIRDEPQRLYMQHYRVAFDTCNPDFCDRLVVNIEARYCDGLKTEIAEKMHELCMEMKFRADNHIDKHMR